MTQQVLSSEVSEVIFQVLYRGETLNSCSESHGISAFYVCNLSSQNCTSITRQRCRNMFDSCCKYNTAKRLGEFRPKTSLARLARLGEVMVFGITSPQNPCETLVFLSKARLARLFPPMLTHVHARMRTRVINNFAYRNGLKITSLNFANLARWFSNARRQISVGSIRRTTLRTDARSLPSRDTSRASHSSRQWANVVALLGGYR
jgi:hypothetical protein